MIEIVCSGMSNLQMSTRVKEASIPLTFVFAISLFVSKEPSSAPPQLTPRPGVSTQDNGNDRKKSKLFRMVINQLPTPF